MEYVKECCEGCLFYNEWSDGGCHGQICSLRNINNDWKGNQNLQWISGNDCDEDIKLKIEYSKKCTYKTDLDDVYNRYRKELGIIK